MKLNSIKMNKPINITPSLIKKTMEEAGCNKALYDTNKDLIDGKLKIANNILKVVRQTTNDNDKEHLQKMLMKTILEALIPMCENT